MSHPGKDELNFAAGNPMHKGTGNAPKPVNANRMPPPSKKKKERRMSSREVIAAAALEEKQASAGTQEIRKPPPPSRPRKSAVPLPGAANSANKGGGKLTSSLGHGSRDRTSSLPKHPDLQLKVSRQDAQRSYRRGSLVDRYRRASVFNEIIAEQQRASMEKAKESGKSSRLHTRVEMIQGTARVGVDTAHRSRLMAFEQVAHSGHDDEYVINPYCVAAMPESIRKAFVTKVLGIVAMQMVLMVAIICIIKYTDLGERILEHYTVWSLLTTFLPVIILSVLFGVRKKHPWNLIVFSLFTMSWAYSLGVACVWLNNRLFISVMGFTAFNTACIMIFAQLVSYDNFHCCSCSLVISLISVVCMFISYAIYPEEPWGNHMWPGFISVIFGSWICWDIKALQIDLTADEYIIGAVDLYLDILNMFLWMLICCLHCFETIFKG